MTSAAISDPLVKGEILAGKYRVERVIGEGGMGQVFAAEHVQLGHRVALKVLRESALESQESVQRFVREARAAARLQSDHIARVSDVGTLESGAPYMVMEFLEGIDLAQVIATRGPLPIAEAVDYMLQASEALADAHAHGIVHRDLKPANLFLTMKVDGRPFIKVLDFGISKTTAKMLGGAVENITSTAAMIGSPKYMSPEQMQDSRSVDARADVWALGAILYELVTGRRAFDGATLATTCVQILEKDPPPPRTLRDDVSPALEAVIMRCLRKEPADRYGDVSELAADLAPFAEDAETRVFRIAKLLGAGDVKMMSSRAPASIEPSSSVRGVATGSSRSPSSPRRPDAGATVAPLNAKIDQSPPIAPAATRRLQAAALVALIAFAIVVFAALRRGNRESAPEEASAAPAHSASAAPIAQPESTQAPKEPSALPTASASASASAVASALSPAPAPSPAVTSAPRRVPRTSRPRPKPAAAPTGVSDSVLEDRR